MKQPSDSANHKVFSYKECHGIADKNVDSLLRSINSKEAFNFLRNPETDTAFIKSYENWIFSSKDYVIENLDKSQFSPYIMIGTTQSFHDFYQIHQTKVLKIKRGEYPYHRAFFESIGRRWAWIDDKGINENDFVIISYPFAGNGSTGDEVRDVLKMCNKYQVPVLLDCAFYALSQPFSLCLKEYPCIKMMSFSLSKFFNVGRLRIGIAYSQYKNKASGAILAPYHYTNAWSSYIGYQLIHHFPISYMYKKYRNIQKKVCQKFDLIPSDTLIFGLGKDEKWKEFLRDNMFYRICVSKAIYEEYNNA